MTLRPYEVELHFASKAQGSLREIKLIRRRIKMIARPKTASRRRESACAVPRRLITPSAAVCAVD
jgi:hypothetical protein